MQRKKYLKALSLFKGDERKEALAEWSGGGKVIYSSSIVVTPSVPLHFIALHSSPLKRDSAF